MGGGEWRGQACSLHSHRRGQSWTIDEGYDRDNPYLVGVVELDEGLKISGRILGLDAKKPESIKVGTPLTVDFQEQEEGERTYLAFKAR